MPWGRLPVAPGPAVLRTDAFGRIDDPAREAGAVITGTVADVRFRGDRFELTLRTDDGDFELLVRDPRPATTGDRLSYTIDHTKIVSLDA